MSLAVAHSSNFFMHLPVCIGPFLSENVLVLTWREADARSEAELGYL